MGLCLTPRSMSKKIIVECKRCKGKGHIIDGMGVFASVVNPFYGIIAICERNDPDGSTRVDCPDCDGSGYKKIKLR